MMSSDSYLFELEGLPKDSRFIESGYQLMDKWTSDRVGLEGVEAILRFMEVHPEIDYGSPGPLTHFAERFYGYGYERCLVDSIKRQPRAHTVWMLIAVINGTNDVGRQRQLVAVLAEVSQDATLDSFLRNQVKEFLAKQTVP